MAASFSRQGDGRRAGIAPRRKREGVHLLGNGALEPRMAVADVVDVVAVEIHVAAAGEVLDPDAFRLGDGVEARGRDRLAQEVALVVGQQRARRRVEGRACQSARRPVRLVSLSDCDTMPAPAAA